MEMSSIQHTVLLILHLVQTQEAPSAYCLQDVCKTTNAKEEDLSERKDKEKNYAKSKRFIENIGLIIQLQSAEYK